VSDLQVRFQDRWLVVVHKPAGLPTQAARGGSDNVFDRLRAQHDYVGLHHRLDAAASGLVLLTLDRSANAPVAAAFQQHDIERRYLAVLTGQARAGTWSWPVQRKRAGTHVEVLGHGGGLTAAALQLDTGRKHQIRVHAAMAGTPIAGDRTYGGDSTRRYPRLALHAWRLALRHPVTGAPLEVEDPLPDDLQPLWAEAGGVS
jgi:23S rRNA-/tRNA-specific pseudouridylate synthase